MPDLLDLSGKVAFVTGGTRGIGWACAEALAEHGAAVAINGRDPARVAARAAELASRFSVDTLGVACDAADATQVAACYQAIFGKWKRLDVLVNNAGVLEDGALGMIAPASIDRVIDTNVKGALHHLQAAARLMGRASAGSIINMSSILGKAGDGGLTVYSASKAAVIGMTLAAAKELAPRGIRVNAIAPGTIDTELIAQLSPPLRARRLGQIGMGRIGSATDVARAALFLASELSSYVTGQVLGVDGGMQV